MIHGILTEFQRHVFEKESGVQYHHRVTLFRRRFGLGPLPGWLIAVERSGYTTRGRVAVFKAPADDPARAEGVAGTAWAQGKIVSKSRLPDLSLPATEAQMEAYAAESFVPVKWVKKRVEAGKLLACSLTAIPLEVRGKPWGVLVLDSKSPDGIPDDHEQFRFIARILGKLLEGL